VVFGGVDCGSSGGDCTVGNVISVPSEVDVVIGGAIKINDFVSFIIKLVQSLSDGI